MATRLLRTNFIRRLYRFSALNPVGPPTVTASTAVVPEILSFGQEEEPPLHHPKPNEANHDLDLSDQARLFASVPTFDHFRSTAVLHAAAIGPMVDLGSWVMRSKLMETAVTRGVVLGLVKGTFYDHFCAGEDADAAAERVKSVYEATGLKAMLVYGVEHADDAASCDDNMHQFLRTIEAAKSFPTSHEMQSIFGEEPSTDGFTGPTKTDFSELKSLESTKLENPELRSHVEYSQAKEIPAKVACDISNKLTHVGISGEAQMVDVSSKDNTKRTALACCKVVLGKRVFDLVLANQMGKGDVLGVAKIAGINGAKHTSSLIPLCHNIALTHVRVDLKLNSEDFSVDIEGEVSCTGKTGVEMEALTAVSVAGLTVYDMCKASSKDISITDVRLERKTGGKSGYWSREE